MRTLRDNFTSDIRHTTSDIHLPRASRSLVQPGNQDAAATEVLRLYDATKLQQYVPLAVIGDGNCLFRAISRGLFGHENLHMQIRLLIALEIITHSTHYDTQHPAYQDIIHDHTLIHDPYNCLLDSITRPGTYSELIILYAASAALSISIQSYCPPAHTIEFRTDSLSRKICGRGVSTDATPAVTLMWTTRRVPRATEPFRPNHFILLHARPTSTLQKAKDVLHPVPAHSRGEKFKVSLYTKQVNCLLINELYLLKQSLRLMSVRI